MSTLLGFSVLSGSLSQKKSSVHGSKSVSGRRQNVALMQLAGWSISSRSKVGESSLLSFQGQAPKEMNGASSWCVCLLWDRSMRKHKMALVLAQGCVSLRTTAPTLGHVLCTWHCGDPIRHCASARADLGQKPRSGGGGTENR